LKFTRDVVVVEVRGAQVDLTLIDLPGIVQNVERPEDEHYKVRLDGCRQEPTGSAAWMFC
jgi:hypothetical protein